MEPNTSRFNVARNKEKSILCLKGLLQGLTADKTLNEHELLFLDVWLRDQAYLREDGDVVDLIEQVEDILEDKIITASELQEMLHLMADIVDYREMWGDSFEGKVNELLGFMTGIAADDFINEQEVLDLANWLSSNKQYLGYWPFNKVAERLDAILEDGVVTEEESEELLVFAKELTGTDFLSTGVATGCSIEFLSDFPSELEHSGHTFCFTGKFATGQRSHVEAIAMAKGAGTKKDVSKGVSVLVIGALASPDWMYSSYGRKVEKAFKLREEGHDILILSEQTWSQLC